MPIYEVHKSYTTVEVHYVRADTAEEACEKAGPDTLYRSYDGDYEDDMNVEGTISEKEYEEYGYEDS